MHAIHCTLNVHYTLKTLTFQYCTYHLTTLYRDVFSRGSAQESSPNSCVAGIGNFGKCSRALAFLNTPLVLYVPNSSMSPQHPYTLHSVNQITADKAHLFTPSLDH